MRSIKDVMYTYRLVKHALRALWLKRRKGGSLIRRFQAVLLVWGACVYLFCVVGFWLLSSQVIEDNATRKATLWISKLDMLSAPLYLSPHNNEFDVIRHYIRNVPEISYISLYRNNGKDLFGQYIADDTDVANVPAFNSQLLKGLTQQQLKEGYIYNYGLDTGSSTMRVVAPITTVSMPADNILDFDLIDDPGRETVKVIGYIDLGLSFKAYQQQLTGYILKGSVFISILFLTAVIIGRELVRNTLRPLVELREPLNRLAKGETDVWVKRTGDEEIAAIGQALNTTISAIKGRDEKLRRLADYDALTGLLNKSSFNQLLDQERQRAISQGSSSALFFIDLDQFKYINDTLGRKFGDRLLIRIAQLLQDNKRSGDTLARLGGDEFAVLATSVNKQQATQIAMSIVKSLYEFRFIEQGKTFTIYCSVGISMIDSDEFSTEEIYSNAEMACHCAKSLGRNRCYIYEPEELVKDKLDIGWSHRIADALANDKFELAYQPVVSLNGDEHPCFEVLLRLRGSHGELIAPNSFISIAERFGLATQIDYWVIENAMKALKNSSQSGYKWFFYINVSGQLFADPDFVDRVVLLLNSLSVDASHIVFELTERTAVGDIGNASLKMEQLKSYGFKFAVDDFGSGFSSFSYLKHLPVEYVKIEGEFVQSIVDDHVDRAMVKSMVEIAKACGKKVIAEYVGDKETLRILKRYGVDYVQGFFIAKPKIQPIVTRLAPKIQHNVSALKA